MSSNKAAIAIDAGVVSSNALDVIPNEIPFDVPYGLPISLEQARQWLAAAPDADVICSQVGALVNVNDFIGRESRAMTDGGTFATGKYRFRYCRTPHLRHGWDADVLFEETQRPRLRSDLFHQNGDVEPLTSAWVARIRR